MFDREKWRLERLLIIFGIVRPNDQYDSGYDMFKTHEVAAMHFQTLALILQEDIYKYSLWNCLLTTMLQDI